jgi:hypothetical protein
MYRLNSEDIDYLILACNAYQDKTGSEEMWDVFSELKEKLYTYMEQNLYGREKNI